MTLPRTVTGWLLIGLLGAALAQGCAGSAKTHNPSGTGAGAGTAGKDSGSMTVEPPGVSGAGGELPYDPLCGIPNSSSCVPDEENNSMCVAAPSGKAGRGGRASAGTGGSSGGTGGSSTGTGGSPRGTGGTAGQRSGTGGTSSPGATGGTETTPSGAGGEGGVQTSAGGAPEGGIGATAGGAPPTNGGEAGVQSSQGGAGETGLGTAGMGATAGTGPNTGETGGRQGGTAGGGAGRSSSGAGSGVSCQVIENPKHKGVPLAVCGPAGTGTEGSPCFSGEDCAPSFACVGEGPGQCRAYCCTGSSQCNLHPGTQCTVEPLVLGTKSTSVLTVPVCMPPVKCSLAETYPCPAGVSCSCPMDTACVVVGDDGTTSCRPVSQLPTGENGKNGLPCPCAPGWVCSQANACVKLCEVMSPSTCDSGRCQASGSLPDGWGTCVGTAPRDAGTP